MHHVDYARDGAAAVITFSNPPVNSFSHAVRSALLDALDRAAADDGVRAIVLAGAGSLFSGGADIREFGTPAARAAPQLRDIIAACEASAKPVIAAIGGLCLGGGFELALGCHYRVARADARVGLPEVKLGLLPGAGGTQRLPRLVGVATALNMILSGERVPARDAREDRAVRARRRRRSGARRGRARRRVWRSRVVWCRGASRSSRSWSPISRRCANSR